MPLGQKAIFSPVAKLRHAKLSRAKLRHATYWWATVLQPELAQVTRWQNQ
jgi:hypothetical protein